MTQKAATKKAIMVVSFGTSYPETLKQNIESVENHIRAAFPDYDVRRAFTSRTVIKRLAERDGVQIDNEVQALERLRNEGYQEVYIQPLHIVAGAEYDKVRGLSVITPMPRTRLLKKFGWEGRCSIVWGRRNTRMIMGLL